MEPKEANPNPAIAPDIFGDQFTESPAAGMTNQSAHDNPNLTDNWDDSDGYYRE